MNESYIITLLLTVLVAVIFIYSLYCLIDLWIFKLKIVSTSGHGKTKHINIYRFLFKLNVGQGIGKVPDMIFKTGIAIKIDGVITVLALIATIALIAITAAMGIFTNATAAIILNNQATVQETTEATTEDVTGVTDENGNWVENKDDQRHDGDTSLTETQDPTESGADSTEVSGDSAVETD